MWFWVLVKDKKSNGKIIMKNVESKQTAKVYRSTFKEFIKYLQNVDLKVLLDFRLDIIESKIISYLELLGDVRKLSFWSVQVHYSAIHHFFEINDVALNSRKIKKFLPSNDSYREDRPYSIEEISRMLDKCDIRQRVIILLLASTGIRVGALPVLRIGDIKKFEEHYLYLIWVYNNSRKDRYYTFCSVECAHAIDDYLAYRKRLGEEIKDSNPLIRNKVTADNPFVIKAPKSIKVRSIQLIVKKLQKKQESC